MSELTRLLKDLGENARLEDQYRADPEGVMQKRGLNEAEIRAMLDRDVEQLRKLSGLDKLKSNGIVRTCD